MKTPQDILCGKFNTTMYDLMAQKRHLNPDVLIEAMEEYAIQYAQNIKKELLSLRVYTEVCEAELESLHEHMKG